MSDPHPADPERKPRLLEQLREAIRYKHYSYRTEQAYVHWVRRFILFCGKRHPETLGEAEVTRFLNHLAVDRQSSKKTKGGFVRLSF
jgi:Phage integrase, N-terminal SAM-like domain